MRHVRPSNSGAMRARDGRIGQNDLGGSLAAEDDGEQRGDREARGASGPDWSSRIRRMVDKPHACGSRDAGFRPPGVGSRTSASWCPPGPGSHTRGERSAGSRRPSIVRLAHVADHDGEVAQHDDPAVDRHVAQTSGRLVADQDGHGAFGDDVGRADADGHAPMRAVGRKPIRTVGQPGESIGPPTCNRGPSNIGQTCMSVSRAAGGMILFLGSW